MPPRSYNNKKPDEMIRAINNGSLEGVRKIADYLGVAMNAMFYARKAVSAKVEYPDIVDFFLRSNLNEINGDDIFTMLHVAVKKNYLNVIKVIDSRVLNIAGSTWGSLLEHSVSLGFIEIVRYIVDKPKINVYEIHQRTWRSSNRSIIFETSNVDIMYILLNSSPEFFDFNLGIFHGAYQVFRTFVKKGMLGAVKLMHKFSPVPNMAWERAIIDAVAYCQLNVVNYIFEQKLIIISTFLSDRLWESCLNPPNLYLEVDSITIDKLILEDSVRVQILAALHSYGGTFIEMSAKKKICSYDIICSQCGLETLKYLREKFNVKLDINHLKSACPRGYLPLIDYIINSGVTVDPDCLSIAVSNKNASLIETLVIKGAGVLTLNPWFVRDYFHPTIHFWRSYRVHVRKLRLDQIKGYDYDIYKANLNYVYDIFYVNRFPLVITQICLSYIPVE
ncbi:MAG: hypothetical protein Hyperionvirus3_56 [Hyperionvirus sp.]|uniref:Ankyrin repeat protein n=1 Tax=Hyperionvirus sp. TaxID=2487770 RepID=A0A3G5A6M0_9VIRU|nr:MAG: hypothetical protein Hyperionvirus3_56 [Hyperionvirus sp.]